MVNNLDWKSCKVILTASSLRFLPTVFPQSDTNVTFYFAVCFSASTILGYYFRLLIWYFHFESSTCV